MSYDHMADKEITRLQDKCDALRAEVERLRVERDEYRAEVERRDALLRADGYEEMRQHAQELALRLAVAERERDEALKAKDEQLEDSERIISALVRERDEARALLQAATDNAFDAGAKAQGLEDSHRFVAMRKERDEARAEAERLRADHDFEYRACEVARADAARLREALVESREAQHKASLERDAHHREEVVLRAEVERLRGLIRDAEFAAGGYIMGNPCCPWCEGLVGKTHRDDCPAFSARGEVRR